MRFKDVYNSVQNRNRFIYLEEISIDIKPNNCKIQINIIYNIEKNNWSFTKKEQ